MTMSKKERVAVYIDANNFFGYLKNKEVNFPKKVKYFAKKLLFYGLFEAM
jgi:hypothetical protein